MKLDKPNPIRDNTWVQDTKSPLSPSANVGSELADVISVHTLIGDGSITLPGISLPWLVQRGVARVHSRKPVCNVVDVLYLGAWPKVGITDTRVRQSELPAYLQPPALCHH